MMSRRPSSKVRAAFWLARSHCRGRSVVAPVATARPPERQRTVNDRSGSDALVGRQVG